MDWDYFQVVMIVVLVGLTANLIPIECLEMSEVKDQPMSLGDRPGIVSLRFKELE